MWCRYCDAEPGDSLKLPTSDPRNPWIQVAGIMLLVGFVLLKGWVFLVLSDRYRGRIKRQ